MRFPMNRTLLLLLSFLVSSPAWAQASPYSGQHDRDIKALSPEEVNQYLSGAGMGYAKSAELNHFPGPMHALELADRLSLTEEQRRKTQELMRAHKAEARAIGAKLVEAERALEALFRSGQVDKTQLEKAVRHAASLQGEYRLSHLETHRRMRALLTDEQVRRYDHLRGYSAPGGQGGSTHKHH
jgi:Spy/CpxP family protein refolding chaperone